MLHNIPYELYHHGIKGQKWGVRRYRNRDGSLTPLGKKKLVAQYKKFSGRAQADQAINYNKIRIKAYNKTAEEYNNGKIEEFNRLHSEKDPNYMDVYMEQFTRDWNRNINKVLVEDLEHNEYYKKAKSLADKYDLYSVDELARQNKDFIEYMKKYDYDLDSVNSELERKYQ